MAREHLPSVGEADNTRLSIAWLVETPQDAGGCETVASDVHCPLYRCIIPRCRPSVSRVTAPRPCSRMIALPAKRVLVRGARPPHSLAPSARRAMSEVAHQFSHALPLGCESKAAKGKGRYIRLMWQGQSGCSGTLERSVDPVQNLQTGRYHGGLRTDSSTCQRWCRLARVATPRMGY